VKKLGANFGNFINDNWEFKNEHSAEWIRSQCRNGLAYGVFLQNNDTEIEKNDPIAWIVTYK